MALFWILEPVAYVVDGAAIVHTRIPAEPVELDADTAAELGAAVRPLHPAVEVEEAPAKPARTPRGKAETVKAQEADGT